MNDSTIESIEATIVCFILNLLDKNCCNIIYRNYKETTDTCIIRIEFEDNYKVDFEKFENNIINKSNHILSTKLSIIGNVLEIVVLGCIEYFKSSNQIIQEYIRKTKLFILFLSILFCALWILV